MENSGNFYDILKAIALTVGIISALGGFILWQVLLPATQRVAAKMMKSMEARLDSKDSEREKRYDIKYADSKEVVILTAKMDGFGKMLEEVRADVKSLLTRRK